MQQRSSDACHTAAQKGAPHLDRHDLDCVVAERADARDHLVAELEVAVDLRRGPPRFASAAKLRTAADTLTAESEVAVELR